MAHLESAASPCSDQWCSTSLTIPGREPRIKLPWNSPCSPMNQPLRLSSAHAPTRAASRVHCCSPPCSHRSVGHWLRRQKADGAQCSARTLASRRLFAVRGDRANTSAPLASVPGIHVDPNARVIWSEVGYASWYGPNYHNKKAANGELYNQYEMTAAHNTLPLNSIVRVVNLSSNQSTVVRITDRGPFVGDRIIDLSVAAAKAIDVYLPGTAQVRLDVLEAPHSIETGGRWCVQIGAFKSQSDAITLKQSLLDRYPGSQVIEFKGPTGYWVRIRVAAGRQGEDPQGLPAHPRGRRRSLHGPPRLTSASHRRSRLC